MPEGGTPIPPQLLAALSARGQAGPMPGASPAALPGAPAANPAAAIAQPRGGNVDPQMAMLLFMAGMGMPVLASTIDKMRPKPPSHHKDQSGLPADARRAPGMAMPPQLAAMLAKQGAAQAPGPLPTPMPGGMPAAPV